MSREDPQFKLRMHPELREKAEQAARNAGRSLNAELVARLESSFISQAPMENLIPAKRARELAEIARAAIPSEIRRRVLEAISQAVRLGHTETAVSLLDLQLDNGMVDEEAEKIIHEAVEEFESAGYSINCEDITSLWVRF